MASYWRGMFLTVAFLAPAYCAEPNRSWDVLMQSLQPGRTVVVTRMNSAKVEGKLLELGPESITVRWRGKPELVPKADVFRVRIANIRRRHTLIGMAVGGGVGAILSAASSEYNRGGNALGGLVFGIGFGALGGGVMPIGKPLYEAVRPAKAALDPKPAGK